MNYISLLLDEEAHIIVGDDLLGRLENEDGWLKMTARIAFTVDEMLKAAHYVGTVKWYSDEDFIEQEIHYS